MKVLETVRKRFLFVLAGIIIALIFILIWTFRFPTGRGTLRVGCLLIGSHDDKGWNESHYEGLLKACDASGCSLQIQEHVKEKRLDVSKGVDKLVRDGCHMIFLPSYGYGKYAAAIAKNYPDTAFYVISGENQAENLTTYFERLYQARYLAGIVAGAATKTNKLGYVAAMPNSQTNRGINAYALGAKMVNPKVKVLVHWTRAWDNRKAEVKAVSQLKKRGADVITYHADKAYAIKQAEKEGLCSIGYDAVYQKWSQKFLTASLYDWEKLYTKIIGDYLGGKTNFSEEYCMGLQEQAVKLASFSPLVSEATKELVRKEKERIIKSRDVFSGVIYDNTGNLRCDADERISDEELFVGMNWFVEGVENEK